MGWMSTHPLSNTPAAAKDGFHFPASPRHNLLWQVLRTGRPVDPLRFFQKLAHEYGDIAHYRVGRQDVVFVNHPEYIRQILVAQHDNFAKERTVRRMKLLVGDGMITTEGSIHREQRQTAQPAFQRQRLPDYAGIMVEYAKRTRASWRPGAVHDIALEMMHLTVGIVARALFSTDLGGDVREVTDAINQIMRLYHFMIMVPAAERLVNLPLPGVRTFRRHRERVDRVVYRMILEHRLGLGDPDDLLALMLRTANPATQSLRDQVITMFLAGYETVSNALTWTWHLLAEHPQVERCLHAEVDEVLGARAATAEDYPRLRYTRMVLAESMRLYPPAWGMGRQALDEFELGGYRLPGGTTVAMSQFIMHRDARYFPDPLRFDPERFTPERDAARPKLAYFPFGAGKRQCIGEGFAWMEGVLVLATIAQKWRLRLVPGPPAEPEPLITLRPKRGMRMRVEER